MEPDPNFLFQSMDALSGRGILVPTFYKKLFENYPTIQALFKNSGMAMVEEHMLDTLVFAIHNIKHPDILDKALSEIGQRHPKYGVKLQHFPLFSEVMVDTLKRLTGKAWTSNHETQWREALDRVTQSMIKGFGGNFNGESVSVQR